MSAKPAKVRLPVGLSGSLDFKNCLLSNYNIQHCKGLGTEEHLVRKNTPVNYKQHQEISRKVITCLIEIHDTPTFPWVPMLTLSPYYTCCVSTSTPLRCQYIFSNNIQFVVNSLLRSMLKGKAFSRGTSTDKIGGFPLKKRDVPSVRGVPLTLFSCSTSLTPIVCLSIFKHLLFEGRTHFQQPG